MRNKSVFIVLIGICLFTLFQGIVMAQTFTAEVKAVRAKNKTSTVEIHDLAAKYVPVGTHKENVLKFCEENGFKIYPVRDKRDFDSKKYDEAIVCSTTNIRWDLLWWFWIGHDEIRVTVDLKNGVVAQTKGFIFFHSL